MTNFCTVDFLSHSVHTLFRSATIKRRLDSNLKCGTRFMIRSSPNSEMVRKKRDDKRVFQEYRLIIGEIALIKIIRLKWVNPDDISRDVLTGKD